MPECDVCGGTANGYECDWQTMGFRPIAVGAVVYGDVVRRWKQARPTKALARVSIIQDLPGRRQITLAIYINGREARSKIINVDAESRMMVWGPQACGKRVCDACMIERDPNLMVICKDHWFSWEKVA